MESNNVILPLGTYDKLKEDLRVAEENLNNNQIMHTYNTGGATGLSYKGKDETIKNLVADRNEAEKKVKEAVLKLYKAKNEWMKKKLWDRIFKN